MLNTLRSRMMLSHVLPLLVIIPLMGIVLINVLETQFLVPGLSRELLDSARLLAEITRSDTAIWQNSSEAQRMLSQIGMDTQVRIMFLNPDGKLLASSESSDQSRLNKIIQVPGLQQAQNGKVNINQNYNARFNGEVLDVLSPVLNSNNQVIGIVRLTYRYDTVYQELFRLRNYIGIILLIGLAAGAFIGFLLALNIVTPIQRVTEAVYDLATGAGGDRLTEAGPEEVKTLFHAVNHLMERLDNFEQARRRLLANLVHELGRPLGALRSAIQALLKGAKDDPELLNDFLTGMDEETATLQRLLDDLAHLHNQVLGTLELDRRDVDLGSWLHSLLRSWQASAHEKGLKWEYDIPESLPQVKIDPARLGQAVGNLTSNAIKFTPPGGKVSVSAGTTEESVWIQVSDTGPGIPQDEIDKIFTPLYRGDQSRRIHQGMGLGLGIARDLVLAHGGMIDVKSTLGKGSNFTIWIPRNKNGSVNNHQK